MGTTSQILLLIALIIILLGINMIFNARKYITQHFPKGDINVAVLGMKIVGVVLCVVGLFLVAFNIK